MIHHARTAGIRWQMINILNKARPHTTSEHFLLDVLRRRSCAASSTTCPTAGWWIWPNSPSAFGMPT